MQAAAEPLTEAQLATAVIWTIEEGLSLPHPAVALLRSFIVEALNDAAAAAYVQSRISSPEEAYRLASDWAYVVEAVSRRGILPPAPDAAAAHYIAQRDGCVCCVSGLRGTILDPLIVAPVLPIPVDWMRDQAFFGGPYMDWWLRYIEAPTRTMPEENHWLVRRSVAEALRAGRVRLDRVQPSMTEYVVSPVLVGAEAPITINGDLALLGDHSRSHIPKVDPRFVGTHARLSKSIQLVKLARDVTPSFLESPQIPSNSLSRNSPQTTLKPWTKGLQLTSVITVPLLRVWLLCPQRLRLMAYRGLKRLGEYLYGITPGSNSVQKLPFGLFLKYSDNFDRCENELNALQTVRRCTTIPVPKGLDLVYDVVESSDDWGNATTVRQPYLLMTTVPGAPLSQCINAIFDEDYQYIRQQLQDAVSQLRAIPKTVNPDMAICNTLGAACQEPRIRDFTPIGPFKDEAGFSQWMRFSDESSRRGHRIVFTHADLNPRNIMVDRSLYEGFRWPQRHNEVMKSVFAALGDYTAEMDVERRSWESGDGL
ncbi:hypothetical protein LLEC1_07714 [Akanthomyces lecanii]|uniref:Aminoglycoside phosphotransferase domain-containing protein n=1 Tax=Cordyceps confragosa TaxID=2714763 RepID=A0A179IBX4_CORDF|nr:hypothetical protein LLEC1_07714 [Akanthomyces lecanii]